MSDDQPRLGKYDIIRTLGQGAMGVVHEGFDRIIERRVAIKTMRTIDLDPDEAEEQLRRFLIEARAAGKLNHPNIVSLYDHGEQDGTVYLVMELVVGRELQQWFDDGRRFTLDETVRLMGELLAALGYSHRHGVIHRDVKPANIFLTESGSLKLGDFGIARIESSNKTRAGLALGTPTHMAPEQIRGETADARSDLYAAGVVLFQLLTGSRPFAGTMLSMALKVLNEPPPLPSTIEAGLPPALDAVVMKALAKTADQRYQSADLFWQDLQQATGHPSLTGSVPAQATATVALASPLPSPAPAPAPLPTAGAAAPAATADAGPDRRAATTASAASIAADDAGGGRRPAVWLSGAAAAALLIGALWWWLSKGQTSTPRSALPAASQPPAPVDGGTVVVPAPAATPEPQIAKPAEPAPASPPDRQATAPPTAAPQAVAPPAEVSAPPPPAPASVAKPAAPTPPPAPAKKPEPEPEPEPERRAARPAAPAPAPAPARTEAAPAQAARAVLPARCSDILMKASLEPLTTEESSYLRRECQ
ncbi:serine/threonine-protein kinase [Piscinibacter sakaiensis]|uniref:serine/threonine-protein kinase n=1 Tax=Piscinibacter sakaiensis TaxID=1547922 RepID=UPI003AAB4F06